MEIREMTNDQLNERLEELRGIGENPGERTAEELETLANERKQIDAEIENRRQEAAAAELRRQKVANGQNGGNIMSIMPENNGELIRLGIPALTEERRKDLTKQCSKEAETAKVSVRNARRDAIEKLKKSIKTGTPEDMEKDYEDKVQKAHDKYIKKLDGMLEAKNKEIMTV